MRSWSKLLGSIHGLFCCLFSVCAAGYEGTASPDAAGCTVCTGGTMKAVAGNGACTPCPAGQQTNAAGTACQLCPADTYGTTAGAGCTPCGTGGTSAEGATTCSK